MKEKTLKEIQKKSMSKKELDKMNKTKRVIVPWNTGTRNHKSKKDYDRKRVKREAKETLKDY